MPPSPWLSYTHPKTPAFHRSRTPQPPMKDQRPSSRKVNTRPTVGLCHAQVVGNFGGAIKKARRTEGTGFFFVTSFAVRLRLPQESTWSLSRLRRRRGRARPRFTACFNERCCTRLGTKPALQNAATSLTVLRPDLLSVTSLYERHNNNNCQF